MRKKILLYPHILPSSTSSSRMSLILSAAILPAVIPGRSSLPVDMSTSSWASRTSPGSEVTARPTHGMMASWNGKWRVRIEDTEDCNIGQ